MTLYILGAITKKSKLIAVQVYNIYQVPSFDYMWCHGTSSGKRVYTSVHVHKFLCCCYYISRANPLSLKLLSSTEKWWRPPSATQSTRVCNSHDFWYNTVKPTKHGSRLGVRCIINDNLKLGQEKWHIKCFDKYNLIEDITNVPLNIIYSCHKVYNLTLHNRGRCDANWRAWQLYCVHAMLVTQSCSRDIKTKRLLI